MRQLRKLNNLIGYHLRASDGEIGKLTQIYFDDQYQTVRYFVVRTGRWLLGNDVLIVPAVITGVNEDSRHLAVKLTREEIKNSPPLSTKLPVSRLYEKKYYGYYGWEPYWGGDPLLGAMPALPPLAAEVETKESESPALRSSDEVIGYHIHARNGEIGRVTDFILEDQDWKIRYLEIDTKNWLSGKKVLISVPWIRDIDWLKKEVTVDLTCELIQTAPEYDESQVISRDYQLTLFKHYGMAFDQE
ncbi:MAG: PRC-barrel domain-containing protein [Desulfuromonadales bacterium]